MFEQPYWSRNFSNTNVRLTTRNHTILNVFLLFSFSKQFLNKIFKVTLEKNMWVFGCVIKGFSPHMKQHRGNSIRQRNPNKPAGETSSGFSYSCSRKASSPDGDTHYHESVQHLWRLSFRLVGITVQEYEMLWVAGEKSSRTAQGGENKKRAKKGEDRGDLRRKNCRKTKGYGDKSDQSVSGATNRRAESLSPDAGGIQTTCTSMNAYIYMNGFPINVPSF